MLGNSFCVCLIFGIVILVTGCDESPYPVEHPNLPRHSLSIEGEVQLKPLVLWDANSNSLETKILAKNNGSETAFIRTGPCSFNILAYTLSESERKLIWSNRMPNDYICPDEMLIFTIEPNKSVQLDGQMYISGKGWKHELPHGEWQFVLEAKSENGQPLSISSNRVVVE